MPSTPTNISVYAHSDDVEHRAAVDCARTFPGAPVSLLLDDRPGFALETLPSLPRPVLVITPNRSPYYLLDLLDRQPEGLLVRQTLPSELPCYLMRVATGETFYEGPRPASSPLTPKEREVLRRTAYGESVQSIARSSGITAYTVGEHLRHVKEKLGVARTTELILAYFSCGFELSI